MTALEFRGDAEHDTVWGSLNQIAELFGRDKSVISRHIRNIFNSNELEKNSVVAKIATTAVDGKTYQVDYYNLDMILSVGYRVDSKQATAFRIWSTQVLKKHLLDGYTINKKRIGHNYEQFLQAVADVKAVLPKNDQVSARDILELVNAFASLTPEALTVLTVLVAESNPKDKDKIVGLVLLLLQRAQGA